MRISRLRIENFRSIQSADSRPSEFNVFVGQNNHGKTNLFETLDWFYTSTGDSAELSFHALNRITDYDSFDNRLIFWNNDGY